MNLLGKDLNEYVGVIKIPIIINIAISLIGVGVTLASGLISLAGPVGVLVSCFTGLGFLGISVIVGISTAVYAGYIMAKKKSGTLVQTLAAGAILGLIVGVVGSITNMINTVINIIFLGNAGANLVIGLLIVVVGPIIAIIIGGICSAIGGVIGGAK
ncbi:MAG: hypothetical protein V1703_03325 [Candidatus Altiarchaeota archaeon]